MRTRSDTYQSMRFLIQLAFWGIQIITWTEPVKAQENTLINIKAKQGYQIQQAMDFGNAGHCLLLEPNKFAEFYVCAPKNLNRRGLNGRKRWKEFCELHSGKNVLALNEWERLNKIHKVFQINPKIKQFWKHGETEVSMFWNCLLYTSPSPRD